MSKIEEQNETDNPEFTLPEVEFIKSASIVANALLGTFEGLRRSFQPADVAAGLSIAFVNAYQSMLPDGAEFTPDTAALAAQDAFAILARMEQLPKPASGAVAETDAEADAEAMAADTTQG